MRRGFSVYDRNHLFIPSISDISLLLLLHTATHCARWRSCSKLFKIVSALLPGRCRSEFVTCYHIASCLPFSVWSDFSQTSTRTTG